MTEHHRIREASDSIEHALHLNARRKLRIVAVIDIIKGASVLAIGFGLLSAHSHVLENGGVSLLRLLDIDPTLGLPACLCSLRWPMRSFASSKRTACGSCAGGRVGSAFFRPASTFRSSSIISSVPPA
jgi:hypothetical protein